MFARLTLRRCIHTISASGRLANSSGRTAKFVLGASLATTTYMTWRLTREGNQIALDSVHGSSSTRMAQNPTKSTVPPMYDDADSPSSSQSPPSKFQAPNTAPTDDAFLPEQSDAPASESGESATETGDESPSPGGSGGAFNPQTGEINWDCPCLGGMAHGPCGPEFREAFSCFVFSEVEPKGIDCVEKFQAMQTCFRAHPEVYADEIMNDDDDEEPTNVEGTADLTSATGSSEEIELDSPSESKEKKPHLQEARTKDL